MKPTAEPLLGDVMRTAHVDSDSWEELATCPICDSSEHLMDIVQIVASDGPGALLSACTACEHFFKRRRPTAEWLEHYYADEWDQSGQATPKRPKPRKKVFDFCMSYLEPGSKVLDMGAGYGGDLLCFRDAGFEPIALEASKHRAAFIRDELGIPAITSPFESADLPRDLGLIFSNHVMEHVTEPKDVVAHAAKVLPEGALLFAAMPNGTRFETPVQFAHYAPHQSGFTLRSWELLLARHGFELVHPVATRELKVLARKTGKAEGPPPSTEQSRQAFGRMVEQWVAESVGSGNSERTLLWWRPSSRPNTCYEGTYIRGGDRMYKTLIQARERFLRLPAAVRTRGRGVLPGFLHKKQVRMLHVRSDGDFDLPLRMTYNGSGAPIWVK